MITSAQETQTNSASQYLLQAVNCLATVFETPSNQAPRTFTTTLRVTKADRLPQGIAGRDLELAFQPPDHLRVSLAWEDLRVILCRDGQQLWVYSPTRRFGLEGPPSGASPSGTATTIKLKPLRPMEFSIPVTQFAALLLFTDLKAMPEETIGTAQCRVLEVKPKEEAIEALKLPRATLQLWLRHSDSFPLRLAYRDDKGVNLQLDLIDPQWQPAWAPERWQLKAGDGDKIITAANYFDNYDPKAPLNATELTSTELNQGDSARVGNLTKFTFDGYKGEKIPALLSLPASRGAKRLPAIIFLHGIGQDKNFLKAICSPFNQAGFAFASFDQYTRGERKLRQPRSVLADLEAFVERPAKTINETRRLIDYLQSRPDIDPRRIYVVGASYGAVMGSTVLAKDKRVRAGVMVYGGGDFSKLTDSRANHLAVAAALGLIDGRKLNPEKPPLPTLTPSQERQVGQVLGLIKPLATHLLGEADPIHYAAQIAPTPVYFQNGTHDVLVPAAAGKALQEAAGEPKKITWYDSDHVGIDREQTLQVLRDALRWLLEQDDPLRAPEERGKDLPAFDLKAG